ncbi:hypothetical protein [Micromonospora sp. NPDC050695]|uniref:P-loop ATPase, Sll1717 family n=1 Tax=Micromonospora sp. NPDC050695 TaxID=3154938 RepID=UPI0033D96B7A
MPRTRRLRSDFNLGAGQAEADPLLSEAFYESGDYRAIRSRRDPRCFVVARTGAGKSAALTHLEEEFPGKVIRIAPQDLSLPYITDIQAVKYLDQLNVRLDLFFEALWKHVLLVEIIRHRYSVDSPVAKQNFLQTLVEKISRDPGKREALKYLEEFEGKFWCETDQRVREIVDKFERSVERNAGTDLGWNRRAGDLGGNRPAALDKDRAEEADYYQRIVNETQLARLNKMISVLNEDIIDSPQNAVYVIIDDLDTQWVDERLSNDLVRCLFSAVLSLKRVQNLKVLVALRTNIFEKIDFGQRGAQGEKFRSLVLNMKWTRSDLREMLDERARAAGREAGLEIDSISDVIPHTNTRRGDPINHIFDRTLLRPRDAISYLNECFSSAIDGGSRLTWEDISGAERAYSSDRLLALRDEWGPSYPGIMDAFEVFRGCPYPMTKLEFQSYLDEVMLLPAKRHFEGVEWVELLSKDMWNSGNGKLEWIKVYKPLIALFFNFGFIGCREGRSSEALYAHDEPDYVDHDMKFTPDCQFFIHPAFHCALDIQIAESERRRLSLHHH